MAGLFLDKRYITDSTSVSNDFIDKYMPVANGEFVKIYLHLLRSSVAPDNSLSISAIADVFNDTEKDVIRALRYWESLGLLTLSTDSGLNITGIRLEPCNKKVSGNIVSFTNALGKSDTGRYSYSYANDEEVSQMLYIAQMYLGRPLSNEDTNTLLYIMNQLGFSTDLIEYLVEYCVGDGNRSISHIERVAADWAENDITSVKEAKRFITMAGSKFYPVLKVFGITGHALAKYQRDYIIKWSEVFGFNMDIIVEACNRTMQTIEEPNFNYADSILEKWYNSNVKNINDIKKLDAKFEKNKSSKCFSKSSRADKVVSATKNSKSAGNFHKFPQRTYDFKQLEQQLISHKL